MSLQDKIEKKERQIKLCNIISVVSVILTIVLIAVEYVTASYFQNTGWYSPVIKTCVYLLYVMPFLIVVPIFFKVNIRTKLYGLKKNEEADGRKG